MEKFLLVDDHLVVRSGIRSMLADLFVSPQIEEAADADSAVEKLKLHDYDLVLMDVHVPGSDMLGLMEFIHIKYPDTRVLVFSMSAENIYATRFLKAGAKGFLPKDAPFEEIKKAINIVLSNRRYISETLAETLADESMSNVPENPFTQLSTREFQITTLMLSGAILTDISKTLHLHTSSVGTYKKRIFDKLGVKNILELKELASSHDVDMKA
jgi:two-component system, NarL family, invasion response regulator UvrY